GSGGEIKKMIDFLTNWGHFYSVIKTRLKGRSGFVFLFLLALLSLAPAPSVHAWRWDEEEEQDKDETEVQLQAYRKRVEDGMQLHDRVLALDRLIKLFQVHKRDTKALEDERAQLVADESAIQTVSELSRQKAQTLFQQAFEQVRLGNYRDSQNKLIEAQHL